MDYRKTTWINDITPLDAEHLNNIETGIENVSNNKQDRLTAANAGENISITEEDGIVKINSTVSGINKPYISLKRLASYLYEITFDELPDEHQINLPINNTLCTSFVKDGKLYRNLDWNYSNLAEFKVNIKGITGMAFLPGLDDGMLKNNDIALGQLPYHLVDGINDSGVMVSTHVLYNDWQYTGSGSKNQTCTKLVYTILSNVKAPLNSSSDILVPAITNILNNLKVSTTLSEQEQLAQYLITDGNKTFALLPPTTSSGIYTCVEITSLPKLTNFRWVNKATMEYNDELLQLRPTGVERWNLIENDASLEDLRFTLAYESDTRLSEFIGINGTTKNSSEETLEELYEQAHLAYQTRSRDGSLWQTMHSVVYGPKGMESLKVQENYDKDYCASGGGDVASVNGKTGVVELTAEDILLQDDTTVQEAIDDINNLVESIEELIPSQATSSNQLADKDFVNSTVGTNTSNYISNNGQPFTSVAQLEAYTGTITNNDYAFVTGTDESGNTFFDRYKATVSSLSTTWAKEYRLNNSSFTASQWAAINSGITSTSLNNVAKTNVANTFSGVNTFTDNVIFSNGSNTNDFNFHALTFTNKFYTDSLGASKFYINLETRDRIIMYYLHESSTSRRWLWSFETNSAAGNEYLSFNSSIVPFTNGGANTRNLGSTNAPWTNVYTTNISNGTNTFLVSNIALKSASNTFTANQTFTSFTIGGETFGSGDIQYRAKTTTDSSSTTYSGTLTSNQEKVFTQPLTSLTITGLTQASGDDLPRYECSFVVGVNMTITLPSGVVWKMGTPTLVSGDSWTLYIKGGFAYLC